MARSRHREKVAQLIADMRGFDASLDLLDASVAERFGISRSDLRAMECVSRGGRVTCGDLATALGLTTGSVTTLVDRMERAGFFQRVDNPGDRRSVMVELTPKGREQERRAFGRLASDSAAVLSRYSGRDLAVIRDFLRTATRLADRARTRIAGHGERSANDDRRSDLSTVPRGVERAGLERRGAQRRPARREGVVP